MISLIDSIKWFWKNGLFYIFHDSEDIYKSTDRRLCRWGQQYSWNYVNTSQSYGVQIFTYFRPSSSFIIPFSDPTCPIFWSWARFCLGLSKVTDFYHEIPKFFVPRSSKIIVLTWLKTLRMFQSLSLMTSELIKKRKIFREILIKKMSNFEYINFSLSVQSFYKRYFIELNHLTPAYFIWKLLRNRRHPISIFLPPKWSFFWIPEFAEGAYFWSHLRLQYQLLSAVPKSVWTWKYKPTSKIIPPSKIYSWVSFSSCLIRNEVSLFRTLIVNKSVWSASGSRNAKLYLTYTIKSILIQFSAESLKLASLTKYQISIKFNRIRGLAEWTTHFRKKNRLLQATLLILLLIVFALLILIHEFLGPSPSLVTSQLGLGKSKLYVQIDCHLGFLMMPISNDICQYEGKYAVLNKNLCHFFPKKKIQSTETYTNDTTLRSGFSRKTRSVMVPRFDFFSRIRGEGLTLIQSGYVCFIDIQLGLRLIKLAAGQF